MLSFPFRMIGGLLVASFMATAVPSMAQPKPKVPTASLADSLTGEAKSEYEAAKVLLDVNDVENALVKFQHVYELSKDYRLFWNVAVCENKLRHYRRAQAALVRYREVGAGKLTPEELEKIAVLDETLAQFISTLELEVNEPGTTIFVDGENVGSSPLSEPLRVDVGKRVFRFEKTGFKTVTIERTMAGNSSDKISVNLEIELHEGKLIVEAGPKDVIALDGKTAGIGRFEGVVASGGHTLRVTASGMTPFQTEVLIKDNDVRRIPVTLNPLSKQVDLAKWAWIGGGAILVVGAVIAGAFMYTPTQAPAVQGSLGTYPLTFGGRP